MAERINERWAANLVGTLVACGVRHVVVAPGSRSTPLALAMAEREELALWSVIDERSAAFFALGLSKANQAPAAVLCTSGTAGAHFLPAVIEAAEGATPLIVITADRPWELHGFGAPQTIDQTTLFGRFVRAAELLPTPDDLPASLAHLVAVTSRAVAKSLSSPRGPVHLNVPFREPLSPVDGAPISPVIVQPPVFAGPTGVAEVSALRAALEQCRRGVIVCGPRERDDGFADAVQRLAWRWGLPVLAEATSNARYGHAESIGLYDAMLRNARFVEAMRPELVIRFGGALTTKGIQGWLDAADARVFHVCDDGLQFDPAHRAERYLEGNATQVCRELSEGVPRPSEYREAFLRAQQHVEGRLASLSQTLDEPMTARALVAALPAGCNLFVSSSMPVRDVDSFAPRSAGPIRVFANRGANGIDGIVSTALGVAAASARPTVAYLGDVALLHDLTAWLTARKHGLSLTAVVTNNDGGGIFSFLPVAERTRHFEALFGTPHGVDLSTVAALSGARLHRPTDTAGLRAALQAGLAGGLHLVEVRTERAANVEVHRRYFAALAQVVEGLA